MNETLPRELTEEVPRISVVVVPERVGTMLEVPNWNFMPAGSGDMDNPKGATGKTKGHEGQKVSGVRVKLTT